jgi:ABC-type nitrate/sulfonate/bicarbonate transport system substrate-binding protein
MVLSCVIFLAGLLGFVTSASAMEDVNLQAPGSSSVNSLIYRIGQERGFYKENGLNVLAILASSQAGIQGLVGGSFHFSGTSGVGTAAAMRGAPLKNVMVFDTRPLFWLYASKKIKSVQDLKGGKVVGISSLGANTDLITREVLLANSIDPRRDVVIQALGTGAIRLQALLGGGVDATILNPLESLVAKKAGFNEILFYGDYDLGIVSGGVIVTDRLLSEKQEFVRRFLRGTLSAFRWFSANEKDATALMAKTFKITSDDALLVYRSTLKSLTTDGTIPLETQRKIIASHRESLKMEKEIAPEKIFDLSVLRSIK